MKSYIFAFVVALAAALVAANEIPRSLLQHRPDLHVAHSKGPSASDIARAETLKPRQPFRADAPQNVPNTLNTILMNTPGLTTKSCESFSLEELNSIASTLLALSVPELNDVYETNDDKRRMRFSSLDDFNTHCENEFEAVSAHQTLEATVRDGKCHEIVMWYVHHTSEEMKEHVKQLVPIPLLPQQRHFVDSSISDHHAFVGDNYLSQTDCYSCHTDEYEGKKPTKTASSWPDELHYNATGYGPFPFWCPSTASCLDTTITTGHAMRTKYSATLNSELLYHASCDLEAWGYEDGVACYHVFNGPDAYIYTEDGEFCCQSFGDDVNDPMGAPPVDWMSVMTYNGISTGFTGPYYSGSVYNYSLDCTGCGGGSFYFWYYTDLNGNPIEQGEGCHIYRQTCGNNGAVYLYHNYDPSTFEETTFTSSDFEIPSICQTTTDTCPLSAGGPPPPPSGFHPKSKLAAAISKISKSH